MRAEGRGDLVVGSDRPKVAGVEIVQLPNKKVYVVRGEGIVLLQIIKNIEGESSRKIPPKDMNRRAGVLRRTNNMHHWGVKGKGQRGMDLD